MLALNEIFRSDMIFQANKPVRFFGTGSGEVVITFCNTTKKISANGQWLLEFSSLPYGGPHIAEVVLDGEKTILENMYAGDVYLLGGQSNMQLKLVGTNEPMKEYKGNKNVRLFTVDRMEDQEYYHAKDGWVELTKENAQHFSALGYYVAQDLAVEDRKIGLIACYQGASVIQTWLPKAVADREEFQLEEPVRERTLYPLWNKNGQLYEYQLKKVLPYSLSAVLWYQGEANTHGEEGWKYFEMLQALIESWRKAFDDNSLRFIVMQIADLLGRGAGWTRVQDAQYRAGQEIDGVDCVITRDICENDDIHPMSKRGVGKRISALLR